ncbi:MAG: T9SS type A sorting domain-containing protein [Muribaculaceae bacterium]|nr:T9SS type A sorting domain-containing protein [Muribaculaceae bacterium]
MKKLSLLFVLALSTLFALAQNGRIDLRSMSSAEITHSDFNSLRATFSYGSIESIEVSTERGTFSEIAIEGTYATGEIGSPELPASHQLLAVPFGAMPRVNVINYTTTDYLLSDYGIGTILPHQPSVRKDQNLDEVEFVYNADAYQTRSLATAPEATIEVQGTMRGIRVGSLVINPVSYNPAANILRVFNDIEVEVSFDGADRAETERMLLSTYSPYFDIVYKQMFNYRQILDVYTDHPDLMAYPVHMIVITPENYISALQPWINWKIQKGFDVNVVTTAQAGGNYNAIQSYVQNLYNTGVSLGATPTFLVLVGDTGQIPGKTSGTATQKVTDLYYGSIDNDYFPDMFYSRMSAENTNQVTAIVNKILQYEQYTMPDPSYLSNVTLIAGWDSYWTNYVGKPTIQYAMQYYYNTAHGFTNVYNWLGQPYTNCYASLSSGTGFVNYTAHGSETAWSDPQLTNSQVNAFTNTNKYFLAMGNCCLTGNFGYSQPCFGEAMLRGENKAAYSYIGSCPVTYWYEDYYFGVGATSTFGQMPNINNTATGVYDGIWMDDTYNTVSSIVFLGNLAVCYAHAGNYQTSTSPLYYWQAYHVLGDGSIMPYRVNPTPNTVSHASTFPTGATSFTVSAEAGSYVGISQNNVLKGAALVPASGTVNVPVSGVGSGQVKIVVTKPQRQPYIQDINVGGGGTSFNITVSANPTNGGTVTGGGTYNQGQSCTVSATANNGFTFTNWTENGNVVSTQANYTFTVTGNRTLVANFQAQSQSYTITVSANPTNGGTVTGGGVYQQGQQCTVSATPATGYTFVRWTENGSQVSTNANYTFTVTGNRTLVAQFQQQTYTINVSATPSNGGTVTGGGAFHYGENCTVIATANNGYSFTNWMENGNVVSSNATYQFTVTGNRTLVAHFQAQSYTITATADPANGGTVTGGGTFNYGQSCTLTATPATGYTFVNWTKNGQQVSTNATYTFTVTGSGAYVAHFQVQSFTVTVAANPSEGGTVSGGGTYNYGQNCIINAMANEGYDFINWTENGTHVSNNLNYGFAVMDNHNFVANFALKTLEITTSVNPAEGGTATGGGVYNYGDEVTIDVETNENWAFLNWTENGTVVSEQKSFTFIATTNRTFVAHLSYTEGIDEQNGNKAMIYPNPVNDKLTVVAEGAIGTVEIFNLMGTLVYSQKDCANKVEINTADLQSGIYFIRMTNDKMSETRRFVKE